MVMSMNHIPEFSRGFRGYRVYEVDDFVSEISTNYEQMRRELVSTKEENEKLKKRLEYFQALEGQLNKTLLAAQQKADEIVHSTKRSLVDSKERLDNINGEIQQILSGASERAQKIEAEAKKRSEEMLVKAKEQASNEFYQHKTLASRADSIRTELAQTLRGFLQEIEGNTASAPRNFGFASQETAHTNAAMNTSNSETPVNSNSTINPVTSDGKRKRIIPW